MTWLAIAVSALGGGIIASLLESWFASLRAYETARLQVLDDLASILKMSAVLAETQQHYTAEERARYRYPTGNWRNNFAIMAVRLERSQNGLLRRFGYAFYPLEHTVRTLPLSDEWVASLEELAREIELAQVGRLGQLIVYGPRYAFGKTGAQPGAQ